MTRLREGGTGMTRRTQNLLKFSSFDGLASLQDEWDELYRESCCVSHYLTFEFVQLWYSCFATPQQIRIYRIAADGETVGLLPLVLKTHWGVRVLSSLTNYHCMHSGALIRKKSEAIFQDLLLKELYRGWPEWDLFKQEYSNDFDPNPELFQLNTLHARCYRWRRYSEPVYTIQLNQSFQQYMASLSAKVKRNFNNMKGRYDRNGDWSVTFQQGFRALTEWSTFTNLENSGWKGDRGSSIINIPPNYQHFYSGLLPMLARSGALWISLLWYENQPIAGGFLYSEGDVLHMFKSSYNERFHSLSPSNMLLVESVRFFCGLSDGLKILNLFPGEFGYKHKYTQQVFSSHTNLLYRRTLRGRCMYRYHQLKALAKNMLLKRERMSSNFKTIMHIGAT